MPASKPTTDQFGIIVHRLGVIDSTLSKIDNTLGKLAETTNELTSQARLNVHRLDSHDGDLTRQEFEINVIDGKLDSLNQRFTWWSGVNSMLAAAAGAVGTLFGVNK